MLLTDSFFLSLPLLSFCLSLSLSPPPSLRHSLRHDFSGWWGFNGGSALGEGAVAINASLATQVGLCVGMVGWAVLDLAHHKRKGLPDIAAILNGGIAVLAGITPIAGYVDATAALGLSVILVPVSFYGARGVHSLRRYGIEDTLEVSAVHGLTGAVGSLAIGVLARPLREGMPRGLLYGGGWGLLGRQATAVVGVALYTAVVCCAFMIPCRRWLRSGHKTALLGQRTPLIQESK